MLTIAWALMGLLNHPQWWMCYCIHIRVTLEEGKHDHPPPSHTWSGLLIDNILQEACPGDWITEAVVLVTGEQSCSSEGNFSRRGSSIAIHRMLSLAWGVQLVGLGELCRLNWPPTTCQKVAELSQVPSWRRKCRSESLGTLKGHREPHNPQLPDVTLNIGHEAQMHEHPIGRWTELMMFVLTTMSEVTHMLSTLEVADAWMTGNAWVPRCPSEG